MLNISQSGKCTFRLHCVGNILSVNINILITVFDSMVRDHLKCATLKNCALVILNAVILNTSGFSYEQQPFYLASRPLDFQQSVNVKMDASILLDGKMRPNSIKSISIRNASLAVSKPVNRIFIKYSH